MQELFPRPPSPASSRHPRHCNGQKCSRHLLAVLVRNVRTVTCAARPLMATTSAKITLPSVLAQAGPPTFVDLLTATYKGENPDETEKSNHDDCKELFHFSPNSIRMPHSKCGFCGIDSSEHDGVLSVRRLSSMIFRGMGGGHQGFSTRAIPDNCDCRKTALDPPRRRGTA